MFQANDPRQESVLMLLSSGYMLNFVFQTHLAAATSINKITESQKLYTRPILLPNRPIQYRLYNLNSIYYMRGRVVSDVQTRAKGAIVAFETS